MTTTERVLELIELNNLSSKEFANMCRLSPGNITDWKTGRSKPSIDSLKKIATEFNVNIEWLLGENSTREKEDLNKRLDFPSDFKYYIEDLPECIVFKIKFLVVLFLFNNITDLEEEINSELNVYNIPYRFRKDMKKAIIYLYNYNIKVSYNNNIKYKLEKEINQKYNNYLNSTSLPNTDLNFYSCPVYGSISAGQPNWAEECLEGYLPIDPNLMNIINPEEHFFLKVNGDSMNKIVKDGAFALIHKQEEVENGEIAVVLVNGDEATLKKFSKQNDIIILEPASEDPTYTTQVYNKNTEIKILGKYVGKFELN